MCVTTIRSIGASSSASTGRQRSSGVARAEPGVDERSSRPSRRAGNSSGRGRSRTAARSVTRRIPSSTSTMREKLPPAMAPLLELNDVSARYGQVAALHGVSLTVDEGEIVALLGANGAGKTTTLRAVSGHRAPQRRGDRSAASGCAAQARRRSRATGIAHVPEGRGIFAELTRLGEPAHGRVHAPRPSRLRDACSSTSRGSTRGATSRRARSRAASSRCSRSRARSCTRPRLLMLDEPSLGLAPLVTREVFRVVERPEPEGRPRRARRRAERGDRARRGRSARTCSRRARSRSRAPPTSCEANDAVRTAYLGY